MNLPPDGPVVLAVVRRFKWQHIDYLKALAACVRLEVLVAGEGHEGAVSRGQKEGLSIVAVGASDGDDPSGLRDALAAEIRRVRPDVVHAMYYLHEALLPLLRELVGEATRLVFECRDPISTLRAAEPGSPLWALEAAALRAADGVIVVSDALRAYYEQCHGVGLPDALVVPHAFAASTAAPPEPKLSAADGRIHLALVGTASADPDDSRWYGAIIRSLVAQGFVVHSHFHELSPEITRVYAALAEQLPDYRPHPTVPHRRSTQLSRVVSRYDLMGVFHELDAPYSETATLAVCLPTKAVSGWFHGAIPVVTTAHYRGVVERIARYGIGFVAETWAALPQVVFDRTAIARATAACLAVRPEFAQETHAARIAAWYATLPSRAGS